MTTLLNEIRLVASDLDDTFAPPKSKTDPNIASLMVDKLQFLPVCIISGGRFEQFEAQVLLGLAAAQPEHSSAVQFSRLHLMPTGTQYFEWRNDCWSRVYSEDLPEPNRQRIVEVLISRAQHLGLADGPTWGPQIEDRGSQITFSALGQAAPVDAKAAWTPDGVKKERLRASAAELLPDLEVRSGGSTSVDATHKGIDKAYGIQRIVQRLGVSHSEVLFVGDRLDVGGNDYPVKALGIPSVGVGHRSQTAILIRGIISLFSKDSP